MGKNQAYKAMQRAKMATPGGPDEIEDGMMDGSFHSPEWHAARLASLQTSHTVTWDEFNRKQKEAERKKGELEADEARRMSEYRAQLDAERASKLARGRNHAGKRPSSDKGKKDKEKDGRNSKRKKFGNGFILSYGNENFNLITDNTKLPGFGSGHTNQHSRKRHRDSSSDSDVDSSGSDDERHSSRRERSKLKRSKKERKRKSRHRHSRSSSDDSSNESKEYGPVPLSSFFDKQKD